MTGRAAVLKEAAMSLQRLILMRHGKAEARAPSGQDFDRALTEVGRAAAADAGRRLADAGYRPDLALVSAARRTLETWAAASEALPDTPMEARRDLFHGDAALMLDAAREADAGSVMIVGHNPGMHALAFELVQRGETSGRDRATIDRGFPPGAIAVFGFAQGRPWTEALIWPEGK
jgi:phosphohistidine phosphatase